MTHIFTTNKELLTTHSIPTVRSPSAELKFQVIVYVVNLGTPHWHKLWCKPDFWKKSPLATGVLQGFSFSPPRLRKALCLTNILEILFLFGIARSYWMGFEQPALAEDVPAHGRGVEVDDLHSPFQPKPFYNSIATMFVWPGDRQKIPLCA